MAAIARRKEAPVEGPSQNERPAQSCPCAGHAVGDADTEFRVSADVLIDVLLVHTPAYPLSDPRRQTTPTQTSRVRTCVRACVRTLTHVHAHTCACKCARPYTNAPGHVLDMHCQCVGHALGMDGPDLVWRGLEPARLAVSQPHYRAT